MKAKVDIKEKELHEFEEKLIEREQVSLNLPETFFYLLNIYRLFFLIHCNGGTESYKREDVLLCFEILLHKHTNPPRLAPSI